MKKIVIYIISFFILIIVSYTIINNRNRKLSEFKELEETTIVVTEITSQLPTNETEIETIVNSVVPTLSPEEEAYWESRRKEHEEFIKENYVSEESILELTKPKPNWDKVDIPEDKKELLKKNYPNGLFDGEDYEDVRLKEDYESLVSESNMGLGSFELIATKGKMVVEYTVDGVFGNILPKDDFEIYYVFKEIIYDEYGNRIMYPMTEKNYINFLMRLAFSDDEKIGKSERFKREHPNFTGILNPYNFQNTDNDNAKWDEKNSSYEDKIAYCRVHYLEYCEDYDFAITWTVDEKGFLDTYDVKTLRKREHYYGNRDDFKDPLSSDVNVRLIYKDRKWGRLPLTSNFKKKFNSKDGLFPKYNVVFYIGINKNTRKNNKRALELLLDDGTKKYVGLIYKIVDEKIDDIEIIELPNIDYSKLSREEIYNMF